MSRQSTGKMGECLAEAFLISKGYRILERGVHTGRLGELDIVAKKGGTLVFVEVKTRRSARYGSPEEAITTRKMRKLQCAIEWYRQSSGLWRFPYRLDVIAVEFEGDEPKIRHLEAV